MQTNTSSIEMLKRKKFVLPSSLEEPLGGTSWECWLSPGSPVQSQRKPLTYAKWLGSNQVNRQGLYIWMYPRPSKEQDKFRFIHVGISCKPGSNFTMCDRTMHHCKSQYTTDRVYRPDYNNDLFPDGFGTLGMDLRNTPERDSAADAILEKLRVLYIYPVDSLSPDDLAARLKGLEGLIAYSAAHLLAHNAKGQWEITNTLAPATANCEKEALKWGVEVAEALNDVVSMLPTMPRHS